MKVLFMMTEPRVMKYYHETLRFMLKSSHTVHVAYFSLEKYRKGTLHEELAVEFPERFSYEVVSGKRPGLWRSLCIAISWAQDYLFFIKPFFRNAGRLRERVEMRISPALVWLMNRCPFFSTQSGRDVVDALLRAVDKAIPASRQQKQYVRRIRPDVLLVSPLISHSGLQSEYLRTARSLGVPSGYCVASWDNLTTKGAIQGNPDYIFLWNDIQKREAIDLHRVFRKPHHRDRCPVLRRVVRPQAIARQGRILSNRGAAADPPDLDVHVFVELHSPQRTGFCSEMDRIHPALRQDRTDGCRCPHPPLPGILRTVAGG